LQQSKHYGTGTEDTLRGVITRIPGKKPTKQTN